MTEYLRELYDRGQLEWWHMAVKAAVDHNARSWAYVRSVLDSWLKNGYARASPRDSPDPPTGSQPMPEHYVTRSWVDGSVYVDGRPGTPEQLEELEHGHSPSR